MAVDYDLAMLRADLTGAVQALKAAVAELDGHLRQQADSSSWLWLPGEAEHGEEVVKRGRALGMIRRQLRLLEYSDELASNETEHLVGALGVNARAFEAVVTVNTCKRALREAVARLNGNERAADGRLKKRQIKVSRKVDKIDSSGRVVGQQTVNVFVPLATYHLRETMGLRRFNLLHAWREIPVAHRAGLVLESISFSRAHAPRRLTPLTVAQVKTKLARLQLPGGTEQELREARAKLAGDRRIVDALDPKEKLAWAKPMAEQLRVNYMWINPRSGERSTALDTAPLPVIYRLDSVPKETGPQILPPRPRAERRRRTDAITEASSLLQSLAVYRYLPGYP